MSQRTDNVNVSLIFTHFYLVLRIVSKTCRYDGKREKRQQNEKKSKAAMKRIATGAIRSIDKTRSWITKKGKENILCDGGRGSKIREKMVVEKKEDE